MLNNLLKKEKYLNCPLLTHSIHFFYDEIRACCSNVQGPVFYSDYKGEKIDFDYMYKKRQALVKKINSFFSSSVPECCESCCELNSHYQDKPVEKISNLIERVYIQNYMSCNAKCTYCSFGYIEGGYRYKVLPVIRELIQKEILSKNALIYMSGGEITISPEFEELFSEIVSYVNSTVEIFTSGIKYSESVEKAFALNKCRLIISLDSSSPETYKKIKQVDCFDRVVENIRNYVNASDFAKNNIILKYIIVDGVNDNPNEISNFIKLVNELQLCNVRLDFDFVKYKYTGEVNVPDYYFVLYKLFNKLALESGLNVQTCEQAQAILEKIR